MTVVLGGHASGVPGNYAATTNAAGHYTINGIFVGTYPEMTAGGGGYDQIETKVTIKAKADDHAELRRWSGTGRPPAVAPRSRPSTGRTSASTGAAPAPPSTSPGQRLGEHVRPRQRAAGSGHPEVGDHQAAGSSRRRPRSRSTRPATCGDGGERLDGRLASWRRRPTARRGRGGERHVRVDDAGGSTR